MFMRFRRFKGKSQKVEEAGSAYYDERFTSDAHWSKHYTKSSYYFIWTVCIDRLRRARPAGILEIGCGPGQLAAAFHDAGVAPRYTGVDFSEAAIGLARKACPPHFVFRLENAVESDVYTSAEYDTVVSTEFLEHVNEDLKVLSKIRPGARILATVPNFPYVSHVRHFTTVESVEERYGNLFRDFSVAVIPGVQDATRFYLMEGIKL